MPPSFLTRQGYQKLQEELEYLRTVKRHEVAERLHEAMEGGELIEDAEYEAAKNEQAFVEAHLGAGSAPGKCRVIEETARRPRQVGSTVTIREGENPEEVYTIVGPAEASPRDGRISNESPLGRALMDHHQGDVVRVDAPGGTFTVSLLKVA
jgi:transcription elongation factor GreA